MARLSKREREEFERRSAAAKKGWRKRKTREKREGLKQSIRNTTTKLENVGAPVPKPKAPKTPKAPKAETAPKRPKKPTIKELQEQNAALVEKLKELEKKTTIADLTKGWVPAAELEWRHRNGTVAINPTFLRHLKETDKLLEALEDARDHGKRRLRDTATQIADHYDIPLREVYTLLYSP